jgi:hypothetical protein
MTRKILLWCGILSSLLYIAINILIPMQWETYSISSQTVSELSAIDAPTRDVWVMWMIGYTLLLLAFGWGVYQMGLHNRRLRIVGILIIIHAAIGIFWPPMHQREVLAAGGGTLTDTLHIVWTAVTVPMFMLEIGFGAAAFGKGFRWYSIATLVVLIVFGVMTGTLSDEMEKNLPTPFMGVWERINIGAFMIWLLVFAVLLLQKSKEQVRPIPQMT